MRYLLLLTAVCLSPGLALSDEPVPTIAMTGTGTVKLKPDEGYITLGVVSSGDKSTDAVRANTATMKKLYATLKSKGVKEEEIQTLDFSVHENIKYVNEKDDKGILQQKAVKDGYRVSNSIQLTVCDLDKFGDILDAVTADGANTVHGIRFGSSKAKEALKEARKKAVAEALEKAQTVTDGLGTKLGKVLNVSESGGRSGPVYEAASTPRAAAADVPVSGGSLTFSVNVSVTWKIDPSTPSPANERKLPFNRIVPD